MFAEKVLGKFSKQATLKSQATMKSAFKGKDGGGGGGLSNVQNPFSSQKTLFSKNLILATVNPNAPAAPSGRKRFLDYFGEIKEGQKPNATPTNAGAGEAEVKEGAGLKGVAEEESSLHTSEDADIVD